MWLVYGPHKYVIKGAEEWSLAGRVAYGMFERLLWGLALAWVTYACHFGGGGMYNMHFLSPHKGPWKFSFSKRLFFWASLALSTRGIPQTGLITFYPLLGLVQRFLSAKYWIPLSRLTFNVYLIHIIVITIMTIGAQGNIHYDFFTIVSKLP